MRIYVVLTRSVSGAGLGFTSTNPVEAIQEINHMLKFNQRYCNRYAVDMDIKYLKVETALDLYLLTNFLSVHQKHQVLVEDYLSSLFVEPVPISIDFKTLAKAS